MTRSQPPLILFNDDGWIMGTYGPPITPEIMREKMIAPYEGSPVGVFLWSVGGHEVYDYETEIGERLGDGYGDGDLDERQRRQRDNLRYLTENHGGPVTVISRLCREAGMRFFPSVRMNEHYDIDEAAPNYGRLRRGHPELLIGHADGELPPGTLEWGIRTGLNYAEAGVRAHMLKILFELIDRFDIDGIELDFMRHPAFFRIEQAFAHRYLATDLVRRVRSRLDEAGAARGRRLELAVRVPPTLADSRRIGLDAGLWMREGLADILIAGGGFIPFETPVASFVEEARGTGCRVLGCFEALRPMLNRDEMRAAAARYWALGIDGLYFFNYYSMPNEWKREFVAELADPAKLAGGNRRYQVDRSGRELPDSQLGFSFFNAIPRAQLPVRLQETVPGRGTSLAIDLSGEDPAAAASAVLGLSFETSGDGVPAGQRTVSLAINGHRLDWEEGAAPAAAWTETRYDADWNEYPSRLAETPLEAEEQVEFAVPPSLLAPGTNRVEIALEKGDPVWLCGVRLSIRYAEDSEAAAAGAGSG